MVTANKFIYDLFMHKKALQLCFDILDLENVNAVGFWVNEETGKGTVNISVSIRATSIQKQIAQLGVYYYVEQFNTEAQTYKYWSDKEEDIAESQAAARLSVSYDGNWVTDPNKITRLDNRQPTFLLYKERDISPREAKIQARRTCRKKWHESKQEGGITAYGIH